MSEWISGKDRIPDEEVNVLVCFGDVDICWLIKEGYYYGNKYENYFWSAGVDYDGGNGPIISAENSHWMPLPEPPCQPK